MFIYSISENLNKITLLCRREKKINKIILEEKKLNKTFSYSRKTAAKQLSIKAMMYLLKEISF